VVSAVNLLKNLCSCQCDLAAQCRRSDLVAHNPQLVRSLGRESQDREEKISPARGIHPGSSENQMRDASLLDRSLSQKLRFPVHVKGVRRIGYLVRGIL